MRKCGTGMNFRADIHENLFASLNQYVLQTRNAISASAAAVLVIHNDIIVNEWYSGCHENTENSRKVDERSQFNVGSIRKTYLGLAVSLALYEGRMKSIDDPVTDYLDDLDEAVVSGTTIRHLLTHTHGLSSPSMRLFPAGTGWTYNMPCWLFLKGIRWRCAC